MQKKRNINHDIKKKESDIIDFILLSAFISGIFSMLDYFIDESFINHILIKTLPVNDFFQIIITIQSLFLGFLITSFVIKINQLDDKIQSFSDYLLNSLVRNKFSLLSEEDIDEEYERQKNNLSQKNRDTYHNYKGLISYRKYLKLWMVTTFKLNFLVIGIILVSITSSSYSPDGIISVFFSYISYPLFLYSIYFNYNLFLGYTENNFINPD